MTNYRIIQIDSIDAYNKLYGWETLHPLVTVVNHANPMACNLNHSRLNYGLYALFLKQGDGCSIRYGREKYDYQEGTVVSFKPGQVVEVEWDESRPMPPSRGLLFHPDLLYGTQLARRINDYTFFDYDQREALHLSEREQHMVVELFDRIEEELRHHRPAPHTGCGHRTFEATAYRDPPARQRNRLPTRLRIPATLLAPLQVAHGYDTE